MIGSKKITYFRASLVGRGKLYLITDSIYKKIVIRK